MRIAKIAFIAGMFFFFVVTLSYSADVAKIGVADFQRILETSSAGKAARAEISKQGEKMKAELEKKGAEIEEIQKRLESEALVMSKEKREEKKREMRIRINDFKLLQKKYSEEFRLHESRLVNRIQKEIFGFVKEIGEKEGYLLIIEKREAGVLYSPNTIDITDELIRRSNARFAKKTGKTQVR